MSTAAAKASQEPCRTELGLPKMTAKIVFARRVLVVLVVVLSLFTRASTWAASVSLAWNPSPSLTVAGYEIFYGLASGDYTSSVDAGTNTSWTMSGFTSGVPYYIAVLAYDAAGNESLLSNEVIDGTQTFPVIITGPLAQTVSAGATASFAVSASGLAPLAFQWFDGAAALPFATNANLTLPNVSDASAGNYSVVITNSAGSVTSSVVTLAVIDLPVITSQPVAQSVAAGASASFAVSATGTAPLAYQWFDGAAALPGATNSTLVVANVSAANAGDYSATIQNDAGTATSATAALTITNANVNAFAPLAGAYNGLFYQVNGNLPSITVPTAGLLGNCVVGTNGVYSASIYLGGFNYPLTGTLDASGNDSEIVSRAANGLSSLNVTLHLDMTGATQLISGSVSNMNSANPWTALLAADLATNALPVPAGNFNMLIPPELGASNSPQSAAYVLFTCTSSGTITLFGVLADGTFVSQTVPVSQNGTIPFYISLYGGLGLIEGWINLAGGVPNGTMEWIRPAGITTANPFPQGFTNFLTIGVPTLAVINPPVITSQPAGQSVVAGAGAVFAVNATGTAPLTYQWFDGATALSGATNATLTLPNVSAASAGNYSVVIANSAGSVTSSAAALALINLPVITTQPVKQTVTPGALAVFNVSVQGAGPFTYQWLHNGTALASGPGLNFLLITASPANLGNYSVAIANSNGSVTSSAAALQTPGPPTLAITQSGTSVVVSWPSAATGFTLQQNADLTTTNWAASGYPISTNGATASVTIPSPAGNLFFRLSHP
jgi:hypothetical protein